MKDVATYSRLGQGLWSLPQLLFGAVGLTAGLWVLPTILLAEIRRFHESYLKLLICVMPISIGILFLSGGLRKLRAAFEKDCWLRAGPEGLSWRVPGRARARTLWCAYDMSQGSAAWKDVVKLFPLEYRTNGIRTGADVIVMTRSGRLKFDGGFFQESAESISAFMRAAASTEHQ